MKSLKSFRYLLITIFVLLIIVVIANLNFEKENPSSVKNNFFTEKKIDATDLKNIIYNGKNKLYDKGVGYAVMEFKKLLEKEQGVREVTDLKISFTKTGNSISCTKAIYNTDGSIKMFGNIVLTDEKKNIIVNLQPPVKLENKELIGIKSIEVKDLNLNQTLSGSNFKYKVEDKQLSIFSNVTFLDNKNNLSVNSIECYMDFKKSHSLFVKRVKSTFNKSDKLSTDVFYYKNKEGSFVFSGKSSINSNNSTFFLVSGVLKKDKIGYYEFFSKSPVFLETNNLLAKCNSVNIVKDFSELYDLTSTNGYYFFLTPYIKFNKQTNIGSGYQFQLFRDNYSIFGKNYTIDNNSKTLHFSFVKVFEDKTENLFTADFGTVYENGKGIFEGNVSGNYNTNKFKGKKLIVNQNKYQLFNGEIFTIDKKSIQTIRADIFNLADNQIEALGKVEITRDSGKVLADSGILKNNIGFLKGNVKVTNEDMILTATSAQINQGYSVFFNAFLEKGKQYSAKSDVMIIFKNTGKVVCVGNALFTDNSTGKAKGDSLTLNVSADTIKLIGTKTKAKVEFKYEKKITGK